MSASQRRKGQVGEREAHHLLWLHLGDIVEQRDLSQARDGGGDIRIPAARVLVEVKRVEQRAVPTWLRQAALSADVLSEVFDEAWAGVVMWRRNGCRDWTVFAYGCDGYCSLTLAVFCDWVRGRL